MAYISARRLRAPRPRRRPRRHPRITALSVQHPLLVIPSPEALNAQLEPAFIPMSVVYFGTNREPVGSPEITDFGPNASIQSAIVFGKANITDDSMAANLEQTVALENLSSSTFWPAVQDEIVNGTPNHLFVYVHGFDYTYRETM